MSCNTEEIKFLEILSTILGQEESREDRTKVGTKSIFSPPELRFSLENNSFPLLTTRKLPLRHIFEELLWFLRGHTDVGKLQEKKVYVWNANSTREFLDNNGFSHLPENEIGKSYGYQFRKSGGFYDQLSNVIHLLKTNPTSRRIIINLWSPHEIDDMVLPPCLFCYQFYVSDGEYLSCKATQRSSDISLAGGWNIATISLLTILLAHICNLKPKEIIWSVGDAHIYLNQLDGVREQITRTPREFPKLFVVKNPKDNEITNFEFDHLKLVDYKPHPRIKLSMNP
jgi:thymidylate synthase